jgi:hypothetical protein
LFFGYWHNSLGQYSVIESSQFLRRSRAFSFETELQPLLVFSVTTEHLRRAWGNLTTSKGLHFVELPEMLKPQIVSILKSNTDGHPLTNGESFIAEKWCLPTVGCHGHCRMRLKQRRCSSGTLPPIT